MDDRTGGSGCLDEGARGSASGMLARMAVTKAGNLGRSWSAVERPSPLSESSGMGHIVILVSTLKSTPARPLVLQLYCSLGSGAGSTVIVLRVETAFGALHSMLTCSTQDG